MGHKSMIFNKKTGRFVTKTGPIGKQIVKKGQAISKTDFEKAKSSKSSKSSKSKSPKSSSYKKATFSLSTHKFTIGNDYSAEELYDFGVSIGAIGYKNGNKVKLTENQVGGYYFKSI